VSLSLWNLLPSTLESASLSIQNLHRFPLESASLLSGICIALPLEPASLAAGLWNPCLWNLHPFPSGICIPSLSGALALCATLVPRVRVADHFLRRFSSRTDNAATKKQTSLSLTGSKTALPVTQKLHPSLGFLFEDFAAAESFLGRPEAFCESRKGGMQGKQNSELQQ
jgi:hypothetical protein